MLVFEAAKVGIFFEIKKDFKGFLKDRVQKCILLIQYKNIYINFYVEIIKILYICWRNLKVDCRRKVLYYGGSASILRLRYVSCLFTE